MTVRLLAILALSLVAAQHASGQRSAGDTVLKGSTIEVIQSYKPQVRKAPKPEWLPQLPPPDTSRPALTFDVPQQTLYYSYTSGELKPLALGKDSLLIPFPNYIKAGAGNLSTLYLDAGFGNIKGKNYETAIHLHHLSQKSNIEDQQTAFSGLETEGVLHDANNEWHGFINVERNQYFFYGYDHNAFAFNSDSIKQTFTSVRVGADMKNKVADKMKTLVYHPSVSASIYDARFNTTETNFGFSAPFSYQIDSTLEAFVTLSTSLTHLKLDTIKADNNLAELKPGVILTKGKLSGRGFLGFAIGKGGKGYVLPEIVAQYLIGPTLILSGGWQASVRQNTYEQLTTENPYLYSNFSIKQLRRDELFASVSGRQGSHITYVVRASWWNFTNLPTYLNTIADRKQFYVVYDDVSALSLHGGARFNESNKWSAGLTADFYKYYQGTQPYVWHQPSLNLRGDVSVKLIPELTVMGYVSVLGGMYALNNLGSAVAMQPVTDIGVNAEYQLVSRLSIFVQVSNLLNQKYERWYGYPAYGINGYGGLRLKF